KVLLMVAAAGMILASATVTPRADAATTLAVGTLAPKGSPWMTKFQEFSDKTKADTGGEIILDFRTYSDEATMVSDLEKGDLAGLGSYTLIGDTIGPAFWSKLGNAPVQVTVPEIFTKLNTTINVVVAPPLVAEQFQWASKLKTITGMTAGFGIGALVFKTS